MIALKGVDDRRQIRTILDECVDERIERLDVETLWRALEGVLLERRVVAAFDKVLCFVFVLVSPVQNTCDQDAERQGVRPRPWSARR